MDPFTIALIAGAAINILSASSKNKAAKKAAARANAFASVKASQLHQKLGRQSDKAQGGVKVAAAERRAIGKSAAKLRLSLLSEALDEKSNIEMNKYFEIVSNNSQAASQKTNLFMAGITGAQAGAQFAGALGGGSSTSSGPQTSGSGSGSTGGGFSGGGTGAGPGN